MIYALSQILRTPGRTQLMIASGMTLCAAVFLVALISTMVGSFVDELAKIKANRANVGKYESSYQFMKTVAENDSKLSATLADSMVAGDSEAVASAAVQSWFNSMADEHGLEINSIAAGSNQTVGSIRMVGIQVSLSGQYDSVMRVVNLVENSSPKLFVTKMELYAPADFGSDQPEAPVTANMTVLGVPRAVKGEGTGP